MYEAKLEFKGQGDGRSETNPTWEECGYFLELNSRLVVTVAVFPLGTQNQPPWPVPPDSPAGSPGIQFVTPPVGMQRNPDPSAQDGGRANRRRNFEIHNGKLAALVGQQFDCLGGIEFS